MSSRSRTVSLISGIIGLCQPNPKYTRDKLQQTTTHKRNKTLIIILITIIGVLMADLTQREHTSHNNLMGCFTLIVMIFILLLSSHLQPKVFNIVYNCLALFYGPCLLAFGKEGVLNSWSGLQAYPILIYLITKSYSHFIIQSVFQIIYVNTFYQPYMEDVVVHTSPILFTEMLTSAVTMKLILNFAVLSFIHRSLQDAKNRGATTSKEKNDSEKQKLFIMGFSHELLNHINSLIGSISLANMEELPEKTKDLLQNAQICGSLLLNLVNNILDTGKVDIADLEISPRPTKIYESIQQTWSLCSELIKEKKLNGRIRIHKHIPQFLNIDYQRINQILLNLVDNAVRFTGSGTIDITVEWIDDLNTVDSECFEPFPFNDETEHDEGLFEKNQAFSVFDEDYLSLNLFIQKINKNDLKPKYNYNKGVLKISVRDTGCGISKTDTGKLFQRFQRLENNNIMRKLGTGLGLFITKQICQKMNGDVRAFSKINEGSTFILCLPVEPTPCRREHLQSSEVSRTQIHHKMLKVMTVDDASFNHLILREFFKKLRIEVSDVAADGQEALQKFKIQANQTNNINIVTMDLEMPVMNGKIAAQKIREYEVERGLRPCLLIIISGNCSELEISECIDKAGKIRANAFLKKPVTFEDLERAIVDHIL